MECERYKEALIDAAAGAPRAAEVSTHLDACPSCRTLFDRDQSLFALIDTGVRQAANVEVPPSLLATVRIRLAQEPLSNPKGLAVTWWIYAAIAATLLLAVLPLHRLRNVVVQEVARPGMQRGATEPRAPQAKMQIPIVIARHAASQDRRTHAFSPRSSSAGREPEVLVPPEEREVLAKFVLSKADDKELVAVLGSATLEATTTQVVIEPLHIARLELLSLSQDRLELGSER